MSTRAYNNGNGAPLPDAYGFHHALGHEDSGAVVKHFSAVRESITHWVRTVYHSGRRSGLQAKGHEFEFQLDGQYQALTLMPARDYLEARDLFKQHGRQDGSLNNQARQKLERKLIDYGAKELQMSTSEALAWAREAMREVAILHNPDLVLGGRAAPASDAHGNPIPGDNSVNSSLGSQNRFNVDVIDRAATSQVQAGLGHLPLNFQVVLTNNRSNVVRLRNNQPTTTPPQITPTGLHHHPTTPTGTHSPAQPRAPTPLPPPTTPNNPSRPSLTTTADLRHLLGIGTPQPKPPTSNQQPFNPNQIKNSITNRAQQLLNIQPPPPTQPTHNKKYTR